MKRDFLFLSESWIPSTFYDDKTQLIWVNTFDLFTKIYEKKVKSTVMYKYAIHKDVYRAFVCMYKNKRSNKKTRKLHHKHLVRKYSKIDS